MFSDPPPRPWLSKRANWTLLFVAHLLCLGLGAAPGPSSSAWLCMHVTWGACKTLEAWTRPAPPLVTQDSLGGTWGVWARLLGCQGGA